MRSLHSEASTSDRSRPSVSAPCLTLTGTAGAMFCSRRDSHASTFLSPFPRRGFASRACRGLNRFGVGSEEARLAALASVRRSNCTCGFPACSFHEDKPALGPSDGISAIKFSRPISPYSFVPGSSFHPQHRHRLYRWDQIRWTIHRLSWLKSLRT